MQDKIDATLLAYAKQVDEHELSCREVKQWLKKSTYSLDDFLTALTFCKYETVEAKYFQEVARNFNTKYEKEIQEAYSYRHDFAHSFHAVSPLYRRLIVETEAEEEPDAEAEAEEETNGHFIRIPDSKH